MNRERLGPLVVLLIILAGLGYYFGLFRARDQEKAPPGMSARVIDVTATNYAFAAPDTIEAGSVTFRFTNAGQEFHHLVIVPLPEGKKIEDLVNGTVGENFPSWMSPVGGPNAVDPGSHGETTLSLAAGRYAMICVISASDNVMHMKKGMARELVVTPSTRDAALPPADLTMQLADYGFTVSAPITAGHHAILVSNHAQQPHEVVVVKLAPGKHMTDLLTWMGHPDGPPPGGAIGGVSPMIPGVENVVSLDLTAGTYGFICFLPAPDDHQPHFTHGMMQEFTVN